MNINLKERMFSHFYNAANYPLQNYTPDELVAFEGIRKCQEICSFTVSATAAVALSKYGAMSSFGGAAVGYTITHFLVGAILKPSEPKP